MSSKASRAGALFGGVAAAGLGWGWFEAGWVRLRTLDVALAGVPAELEGLRVAHLADFHLGQPSRGRRAVERAVDWVAERRPDLVCISGDLVSHPRGERVLRELLHRLDVPAYAVLGNHDVERPTGLRSPKWRGLGPTQGPANAASRGRRGLTRDPFSRSAGLTDLAPARLLVDEAETIELRGRRVQIVGVDPRSYRRRRAEPWRLADPHADLRILVCHFPYVLDRLPDGAFDLVLAGHLHDGQITIPYGFGKLRLAHLDWRYTDGIYVKPAGTMHVSPGLGTTFVPFRFFARPEATELVLHPVP
jgi:predicted MPP superfamily phosphohydrolase